MGQEQTMQCAQCAAINPDGNRFCGQCGAALEASCPSCSTVFAPGQRFCSQCGVLLTRAPRAATAPPRLHEAGERKHVTILFADIRGSTELIRALDPEAAMEHLDPALEVMAAAVRRYGGTVNRVQGDGIMALFGAPIAREDHAASACLAAQAMIRAARALQPDPQEIRVGLHSGLVVIRPTGNDPSDWDAAGVAAHLANRMEQIARPGTACLSGETARLARGFIDVAPLGPMELRGLDAPIEVFELLSVTDRSSWEVRSAAHPLTRFVGREAELGLLDDALRRAGLGRGQAVTLLADAGTGKSRLAQEFLGRAPADWRVLLVAALPHDTGTSHRVAADLLRAWLGTAAAGADAAGLDRLLRQSLALSDPRLASELPALQALLDLPVTDTAAGDAGWAALPPLRRRARIAAALRLLVLAEARVRPLILLIEDLHWIDDASREVLAAIVQGAAGARLLVLATARPFDTEGDGAPEPGLGRNGWCSEIRLAPLDEPGADAMLRHLLGDGPEMAQLRRQVIAQTDGTPLFLEEVARSLLESGVVVSEPPRVRVVRSTAGLALPGSVQGVIAARVDHLPLPRRELLQLAAVCGREVPLTLLRALAELPEAELEAELAALQQAEFLFAADLPGGIELTFKHALTQAVAYDGILRRRRRDLHVRVLRELERSQPDAATLLPERLAHHATAGEDWEAAVGYAQRAGQRANARSAWRDALAFFGMALEALVHLPDSRQNLERGVAARLGARVALLPLGEYARAIRYMEQARDGAKQLGDAAGMTAIDINACALLTVIGRLEEAIEAGRRARDTAMQSGDRAAFLDCSYVLGQAYWFRGDFAEAEATLLACLPDLRGAQRLARTSTTGTASVLALVCLAKTYAITGDFARALELTVEAQEIARQTGRAYDRGYAGIGEGFTLLLRGQIEESIVALEAALAHARAGDITLLIPSIARYLGRAYAEGARHAESERLLAEAMDHNAAQNLLGLQCWCGVALAATHRGRDRDAMSAALAEAHALAERHDYLPVLALAHRLQAQLHHDVGTDLASAEAACRRAIGLATRLGMRPELAHATQMLGALLADQGRGTEAHEALAAARRLYHEMGMRYLRHPLEGETEHGTYV
jgi:class 3 adenylate cyclase/tetratricopeptide (TPR) repeat protein